MHAMLPRLQPADFPAIRRGVLDTLQVNLGYLCNLACVHCHVSAGPKRKELMRLETIEILIRFLKARDIRTLDITGGSPEMNPHFRYLVEQAVALGVQVMDRCNPTIIEEPGYDWVPAFMAANRVQLVASLPCYSEQNVDTQRGKGVFERSITALRKLNDLGYGKAGTGLELNLVYNPLGPALPPPQAQLELDYKQHLRDEHGIEFNSLFTLANMPIQRFGSLLVSRGEFSDYMETLKAAHRKENLANVMCRNLISVDWQGQVFDCDFNQMLELPLKGAGKARTHISELLDFELKGAPIAVANHCYGCTAGQGSSCGGALS
ncbi:MAG: arsenosugar biosynthesis radical SAM (seleno)protein ArsS [Aquisalimonadaceae bacterium]